MNALNNVRSHSRRRRASAWLFTVGLSTALTTIAAFGGPPPPPPPGPGGPGGPFRSDLSPQSPTLRDLYPPELILENQGALSLTEDQIQSIKKLLQETHITSLDIQITLQRNVESLRNILDGQRVDEAVALAAADKVMQLESATKRAHLSMLIKIKNLMTAEQVKKLESMRPRKRGPHPEPPDRAD